MSDTLITAHEVVRYGPVHPDYPTAFICDHIPRVEYSLFRACYLGVSFYTKLIDDMRDFSAVPAYDAETTYGDGALVLYDGVIFESTIAANNSHPEDNLENWQIADKFQTSCYNLLWKSNLRYWLSFEICLTSLDYTTYHLAAHGATRQTADATGQETVSSSELDRLKRKIRGDADNQLDNMLAWMVQQTNVDGCDFSSVPAVSKECDDASCVTPPKRRGRRMHFKK